jgi:hypothetical protein
MSDNKRVSSVVSSVGSVSTADWMLDKLYAVLPLVCTSYVYDGSTI